jgi:serine/alanine adding enzyme
VTTDNIFQSDLMYEFLENVNLIKPYKFIVKNNNDITQGHLFAYLIKEFRGIIGYFSSRVVIFGGPVIFTNNVSARLNILDSLLGQLVYTLRNKSVFIQFRNFHEWTAEEKEVFEKHGFIFRKRESLLINLSSEEIVLKGMSESKRRQIRIAQKHGAITRSPRSEEEVRRFYLILKVLYSRKIRKPLPDFSFFKEFYRLADKGLGIIRVVVRDNEIIGGVVAPITSNETIYYWYVAGLDHKHKHSYPSVMAVWSLIEYGLSYGIKQLDFMGIGNEGNNYGVREFKMRFSKNVVDYGRFGRRNNKLLYILAELGYNLLRIFKRV